MKKQKKITKFSKYLTLTVPKNHTGSKFMPKSLEELINQVEDP